LAANAISPGPPLRGVFGHEDPAARERAAEHPEEAFRTGGHRRRVELHVLGHPRELAGFGDDHVAGFEPDLQHR
jgi:hypothetical protein